MTDFPTNRTNTITTTKAVIQIQEERNSDLNEQNEMIKEVDIATVSLQNQLPSLSVDYKRKFSLLDDSLASVLATITQFADINALLWEKMDKILYIMDKFSQKTETPILSDLDEIDEYLRLFGLSRQWDSVLDVVRVAGESVAEKSRKMGKMAAEMEKCRTKCIYKAVECNIAKRIGEKLSILCADLHSVSLSLDILSPSVNEIHQSLKVNEWMKDFEKYYESEQPHNCNPFCWNDVLVDELGYLASNESVNLNLDSLSDTELDVSFGICQIQDQFDIWMEDFNGYFHADKPTTKPPKVLRWNLPADISSEDDTTTSMTDLDSFSDTDPFEISLRDLDLESVSSLGSIKFDSDFLSDAVCGAAYAYDSDKCPTIFCPADMNLSFETCCCFMESLETELDSWMKTFADYPVEEPEKPSLSPCTSNCRLCLKNGLN